MAQNICCALADISVGQWLGSTLGQIIKDLLHLPQTLIDRLPKMKQNFGAQESESINNELYCRFLSKCGAQSPGRRKDSFLLVEKYCNIMASILSFDMYRGNTDSSFMG